MRNLLFFIAVAFAVVWVIGSAAHKGNVGIHALLIMAIASALFGVIQEDNRRA